MTVLPSVTCPGCGARAMTLARRLSMGPLVDHECKVCGRILTVTFWRWAIVSIPLYVTVFALLVVYPEYALAIAPGGLLAALALTPFVPLTERRD
ncbi:MAG TPA: hypothetical protein VNN10_10055 [Dehalococcoidia bacterium]|jgi:hypothetical protein|nr:hypothetical protein [Dehalococcoidia bacterium]